MSYRTIAFEVRGVSPLLMHNGQLADPCNSFSKEMKKVTSKRKKTEEDHAEMSRIEFMGSLYVDENKRPCIPGEILEATITNGAKVSRSGKAAKSGIIVDGNFPLEYEGPKTPEKLFENDNFRHVAGVRVGTSRVMRTRPKFNKWGAKFTVNYRSDLLNHNEVVDFVKAAGSTVGLMDNRPRFGRFEVLSAEEA